MQPLKELSEFILLNEFHLLILKVFLLNFLTMAAYVEEKQCEPALDALIMDCLLSYVAIVMLFVYVSDSDLIRVLSLPGDRCWPRSFAICKECRAHLCQFWNW